MSYLKVNHKVSHNVLQISSILLGYRIKSEIGVNHKVISKYSENMLNGVHVLPITVFFDGSTHWLVDGLHRLYAMKAIGETEILAKVIFSSQCYNYHHPVSIATIFRQQISNIDRHCLFEEILYAGNRDTSLTQDQILNRQRPRRCRSNYSLGDFP